ncbi:MAG: S16 family serine protease [Propioniciclava sp.]
MSWLGRTLTALLAVMLVFTSGCSAVAERLPGGGGGADGTGSVTVTWLAYTDNGGTTGKTTITREAPETPGDFRVEFSANEVGGIGDKAQAGAWSAAITATLLLGAPLEGRFSFETDGMVDGPSAGALTTAGIMTILRGDDFLDGVTMTGTINTTGTIGPVGGIPEKVVGAAEDGFTKVLIPLGNRNSQNQDGETVDVVREGERNGVEVIEVGDIYQAYELLTGEKIEVPGVPSDVRLDNASYDKIKPQTEATLARYQQAHKEFERLPADIRALFVEGGQVAVTEAIAARAEDLSSQGLQAGAFTNASSAAILMEAMSGTGELLSPLATRGIDGIGTVFDQASDISVAQRELTSFLDRLATYEPKTVADVEGLVNGFAGAFDAYSLLLFAQDQLHVLEQRSEEGSLGTEELVARLAAATLWREAATGFLESSKATFEAGRDNPGVEVSADVDLGQVGDFFRLGAEANFTAFKDGVVALNAEALDVSNDRMMAIMSQADLMVATATGQPLIARHVSNYIGEDKPNAQYATLAYGLSNYSRNQALMNKYYNNAIFDENLQITGLKSDAAMSRSLDLGRQQLAGEIQTLRDGGTEPVLSVGSYEVASLLRSSEVTDQFEAVIQYSSAFVTARMMGYLAGYHG